MILSIYSHNALKSSVLSITVTICNMNTDRYEIRMSSTPEEFLDALGIDLCKERYSEVYVQMLVCTSLSNHAYTLADLGLQREVERGRLALANERSSLLPHLKNDKSVQAPFSRTQIDYLAFLREARNIYANAGPLTRAFYDSAEKQPKSKDANCVIKWLL
jgi:hypothetical protein